MSCCCCCVSFFFLFQYEKPSRNITILRRYGMYIPHARPRPRYPPAPPPPFFFAYFYCSASRQAVVTGVVPSPSPVLAFKFYRAQGSAIPTFSSIFHRVFATGFPPIARATLYLTDNTTLGVTFLAQRSRPPFHGGFVSQKT